MGLSTCKDICIRDQWFKDRIAKRFGSNNNTVYDYLRKYCSNCKVFVQLLNEEEYYKEIKCPCCGYRFRTRPANKAKREKYNVRINKKLVYY